MEEEGSVAGLLLSKSRDEVEAQGASASCRCLWTRGPGLDLHATGPSKKERPSRMETLALIRGLASPPSARTRGQDVAACGG